MCVSVCVSVSVSVSVFSLLLLLEGAAVVGRDREKKNRKQHILSLMACRGLSQARCAKMERFLSHASARIFAPAGSLLNQ